MNHNHHHPNVFGHFISEPKWMRIPSMRNYEMRILHSAPLRGFSVFLFSAMPPPSYLKYRQDYLGYGNKDLHEIFLVANGKGTHLGQ